MNDLPKGQFTPFACGVCGKLFPLMPVQIGVVEASELTKQAGLVRTFVSGVERMLRHESFVTLTQPEVAMQIWLTPADMSFTEEPLWDELFDEKRLAQWSQANFDGYVVELNPAEVGPHMAIQYTHQPKGETVWIAMKTIPGSDGFPLVFGVGRGDLGELWLDGGWFDAGRRIRLGYRFSFRLRKVDKALASQA